MRSDGAQSLLELRPERRDAGDRHPEDHHALEEEEPVTGGDVAVDHLPPAEVDEQHRAQPGDEEEEREDRAEDPALLQQHPVRLLVDRLELAVERALLPEVLGDGDAVHRLLNRAVHPRRRPLRLLRALPGNLAEHRRHHPHHRRQRQRDRGEIGVAAVEDADHDEHQQDLAEQVHRQRDDIGEVVRIRGHAADDLARRVGVVEGEVAVHRRVEGVGAQRQHHVAHHARGDGLADVVEPPRQQPGGEDGADKDPDDVADAVVDDLVDAPADDQRLHHLRDRVEGDHRADEHHRPRGGPEVAQDAAQQLAVAVLTVIVLGVEAVHHKAHGYSPSPAPAATAPAGGWISS